MYTKCPYTLYSFIYFDQRKPKEKKSKQNSLRLADKTLVEAPYKLKQFKYRNNSNYMLRLP